MKTHRLLRHAYIRTCRANYQNELLWYEYYDNLERVSKMIEVNNYQFAK